MVPVGARFAGSLSEKVGNSIKDRFRMQRGSGTHRLSQRFIIKGVEITSLCHWWFENWIGTQRRDCTVCDTAER